MPHWLIKAFVQRAISWLPASHRCNEVFQRCVTRTLDLTPARFEQRLEYCRLHLEHLMELRPGCAEDFTALELGTGWYPVVPLGFYLCGAAEIWTFDIHPLLSAGRLRQTIECLMKYEETGALRKFLPRLRGARLERLRDLATHGRAAPAELLKECHIHVLVRDARQTGLPPGSVDLFASTGVLEYIPREAIAALLDEFRRLGSPNAVQSHYLNLADQYTDFDRSITVFNYLKYSGEFWRYFNSPLSWQNRLRISDYRALFVQAGFQITKELSTSGAAEDLRKIRLAPEFRHYSQEDLLVLFSWLVGQPNGSPIPSQK